MQSDLVKATQQAREKPALVHSFSPLSALVICLCIPSTILIAQSTTAPAIDYTAARKTAAADPLLNAMQAELERERSLLVLDGQERPYFIEYRLDDIASFDAVANYGAVARQGHQQQRVVRVEVRVGDYGSDSSTNRGEGVVQLAPDDNDPAALRYALWSATDDAYKAALRNYATKQATLKRFERVPAAADFARVSPAQSLEPVARLEVD